MLKTIREVARLAKDNDLVIAIKETRLNQNHKFVFTGKVEFYDIIKGNKAHEVIILRSSRHDRREVLTFEQQVRIVGQSEKGFIFITVGA
jgi:hypothetical protein